MSHDMPECSQSADLTSKEHFEEFQLDEALSWKFHWIAGIACISHAWQTGS